MRRGRGHDTVFGEVTQDRHGFWQHPGCRHWTETEVAPWSS
jgi:hypothetical protein